MASFEGKKDFSAEVQAAATESLALAQGNSLEEAITYLLPLEKKCRINNDFNSLKEVSLQLVRLCKLMNDWEKLNAVLALINKRSSQIKSTLTAVVAESMGYLDQTPNLDTKIALITALKDVCDGKIYVEGESAHLHFMLAKIYEDQSNIPLACDTIQDVHVETYGSLSKQEKANYILEQIRLNLLKKDMIRTAIHSRKMNLKTIEEDGFEEIKVKFYKMQIEYHTFEKNAWEIAQAYFKISSTKLSEEHKEFRKKAIENCIVFLLSSKFDNHQSDMMFRVKSLLTTDWKDLGVNKLYTHALHLFTTDEIIVTPFQGQQEFEQSECLFLYDNSETQFSKHFVDQFRKCVIEHNLRVVSKYYKRIRLSRLAELTNLLPEQLERHLSELSFSGDILLKIDRPNGIVSFEVKRSPEEVLSEWSSDISKMMQLMETTCHLINRENMVHKA